MKQEPKILVSTCPKSGRVFLIRTRPPAFIAEIHHFTNLPDTLEFELNVPIGARYQHHSDYYVLNLIRFFEPIHISDSQEDADALARLMRRSIDWYAQAIIKKEI